MDLLYYFWSCINVLSIVVVIISGLLKLASIVFDIFGHEAIGTGFFIKSISLYIWVPVAFVVLTRALGVNNGWFPI
jgi:hypothetical protein